MRVLIAREFSGIVRDAFAANGHDAWSCDLLPTERPGNHIQGDVFKAIGSRSWDLMIAHPPCTHLAVSGARWFKDKLPEQRAALRFVARLLNANVPKIALENPVSIISSRIRKPDQVIQPWMFGHGEIKATCLWLKGLSPPQTNADSKWSRCASSFRTAVHGSLEESQPDTDRYCELWQTNGALNGTY